MTIFRRRQEFGILNEPSIEINDAELRVVLSQLRRTFPELGEKMVIGHLRSLGYNVTRSCIRNAIRVTDPISVALRWQGNLTVRRPYLVPGPNSLWHIGMYVLQFCYRCTYIYIYIYMHYNLCNLTDAWIMCVDQYRWPSQINKVENGNTCCY